MVHHVDPYTLVALTHRPPFLACSSQLYFDIATEKNALKKFGRGKNGIEDFGYREVEFLKQQSLHASNF